MLLDFLGNLERTHTCGELRAEDAGKSVVLLGWVNRRRDHGNLIFLDLRDRYGISQVVLDKELSPEGHAKAEQARPEYVVAAIGRVRLRGKDAINPKMVTGEIEIVANEVRILNDAKVPPFSPAEDAIGNEEVRLKYRYLDLRRAEIQHNFEVRHKVTLAGGDTGFFGHVGEMSLAIVFEKAVVVLRGILAQGLEIGAVGEENVEFAVVVVVENGHAASHGFRRVVFWRLIAV